MEEKVLGSAKTYGVLKTNAEKATQVKAKTVCSGSAVVVILFAM